MNIAQKASGFAHEQASKITGAASRKKQSIDEAAEMMEGMQLEYPVAGQVSLGRLQAYVIAFVVIGISGTIGLDIMSAVQSGMNNTAATTGADKAIEGMNELLGFLPVIGLVVAAATVIGLVSGFGGMSGNRGRA